MVSPPPTWLDDMHLINKLYEKEFDFAYPSAGVQKSLMVATLPRSGSTYFCIRLWQTGVLGAPMEYPNFRAMGKLFARLGASDWSDYWSKVKHSRTGPNGVYGYKLFMSDMMEIGRNHPPLLKELAADHVVYLTRENIVDQALSYARAIKTRSWFRGTIEYAEPTYHQDDIIKAVKTIKRQHVFWENVFSLTNANVYRTTYERFLQDPESIIEDITRTAGVEVSESSRLDIPVLGVQRDELTEEWRERFLNEVNVDDIKVKDVSISSDYEPIQW